MTVTVKIIENVGYIKKGSLGAGFGAWSRAARIRDKLNLNDLPRSVTEDHWRSMTAQRIEDVSLGSQR
jgi:hypothetical protein